MMKADGSSAAAGSWEYSGVKRMTEVRTVKTGSMEMRYARFGTGQKQFVILPGLSLQYVTDSAEAVAEAYGVFSEEYTVWLFDRRSDLPAEYPVREMAGDTAAAFDALGIRDVYLFGASQGGMIAQFLAIDRPDLLHALVLGSSAARIPDDIFHRGNEDSSILSEWIRLAEAGDAAGLTLSFAQAVYTPAFFEQYKDLILASAGSVSKKDLDRFLILARGSEGMDSLGELGRIQCPVLVLGAAEDRVLGAEASRELAEKLGCAFYIYEGYGHAVYDEAPDYKKRIRDFFTSTDPLLSCSAQQ